MSLAALMASLMVVAPALAQETHGHWVAGYGAAPGQTFTSPEAACINGFNTWNAGGGFISTYDGMLPGSGDNDDRHCGWHYTGWMVPKWQVGMGTWIVCDSGYRVTNGRCDPEEQPDQDHCHCSPNPIDFVSGVKFFRIEDYATADGGLSLTRLFSSQSYVAANIQYVAQPIGLGNWLFDFQAELQVPSAINYDGIVALMMPDGDSVRFLHQSDDSWAVTYSGDRSLPRTDYKLELLDTLVGGVGWLRGNKSHWRLTDKDDNVWLFETFQGPNTTGYWNFGRPTSITAKSGLVRSFTYNSMGTLQSMSDNRGKSASFTWNVLDTVPLEITGVSLPGGESLAYTYEPAYADTQAPDRLKKVEYKNSSGTVVDSTSYDYGMTAYPTSVTGVRDKDGTLRWSVTYDSNGRATASYAPGDILKYTLAFAGPDMFTSTRTVTNPLGKQTVYTYSRGYTSYNDHQLKTVAGAASANTPASSASKTYNSTNHFLASETDEEGRVTQYTRDARGRPTQIKEAAGTSVERITNITWHATWNTPSQVVEPKKTTDYTYDTQGRLTSKTETDTTSYTSPYSTNGRTRTWNYTWSSTGQLLTVDGPMAGSGDTVTYTYNSSGFLATVTDEVGHVTTVSSWNSRGQPLTVTDANSVQTTLTYDTLGRPLTVTVNPGGAQSQYAFEYDVVGNLTKMTLPGGGYLQYAYDTAKRPTSVTNDRGETQTIGTNLAGDVTSVVLKTSGGTITAQRSGAYDELSRVIQSIGAGSETTSFAYDKVDNLKTLTDARSKVFGATFDALNRVTVKTDPESHTIQTAYDAGDNLTSHKDGRALETTRVVDGFGRTIQEVSPDRGTTSYWYDLADNLTKRVDGDGQEVDFTYDNASRLTGSTYPGASAEAITYTYDSTASGNKGVGRLTGVTEESGSTAYVYDAQGRATQDSKTIQGRTYAVGYAYDANGKVTQVTLPSGRTVSYTRASDGLVSAISTKATPTSSSDSLASSVTYRPFGPLASLTYGNGLNLTRTFDQNYWLTQVEVKATGVTRLDLSYGRNANGQLTSVTDNASSGRGATFGYTDSGRLNAATGPWGADAYTYDAAGNRTDKARTIGGTTTHETPIVASTSNRVNTVQNATSAVLRTFTYRTGGDLSQDVRAGSDTWAYSYNARKRLVVSKKNGTDAGYYGYDYQGHRVWRTVFGTSTVQSHYIYDLQGHLIAEHDGATGAVVREYVWLDDTPIAMIDSSSGTAQTYYIHTGQIEEPLVMTDSTKAKVWDGYVEPYGQAQVFGTPSAGLDIRLPGQFYEAETGGLNQNWNRNYDPSLGRYAQVDPLGIDVGQDPYVYVDGDPLSFIDAGGLDATISLYPGDTGHLGIKISGHESYGYYPSVKSPIYPGTEARDKDRSPAPIAQFTIPTTKAQDAKMWAYIQSRINNPGWYLLIGRSCVDMVEDTLKAGGLTKIPTALTPRNEYQALRRRFDPTWGNDVGDLYVH